MYIHIYHEIRSEEKPKELFLLSDWWFFNQKKTLETTCTCLSLFCPSAAQRRRPSFAESSWIFIAVDSSILQRFGQLGCSNVLRQGRDEYFRLSGPSTNMELALPRGLCWLKQVVWVIRRNLDRPGSETVENPFSIKVCCLTWWPWKQHLQQLFFFLPHYWKKD